jgi:hypothetical protein
LKRVGRSSYSADLLDDQLIGQLVARAKAGGLQLTGEGGLLQQLTKRVLESALEGEITGHLGYEKHDAAGDGSGNSRNGTRSKTVLTEAGPVGIQVPRDRDGSFEPQLVETPTTRAAAAPLYPSRSSSNYQACLTCALLHLTVRRNCVIGR